MADTGSMGMKSNRFIPIDYDQMRLLGSLPAHQRVRRMLDARELVVGLKRGQLRQQFPDLSDIELNLKLIQELNRAR
jgi:hypothetical protein